MQSVTRANVEQIVFPHLMMMRKEKQSLNAEDVMRSMAIPNASLGNSFQQLQQMKVYHVSTYNYPVFMDELLLIDELQQVVSIEPNNSTMRTLEILIGIILSQHIST